MTSRGVRRFHRFVLVFLLVVLGLGALLAFAGCGTPNYRKQMPVVGAMAAEKEVVEAAAEVLAIPQSRRQT